jgi:hypothetical protein
MVALYFAYVGVLIITLVLWAVIALRDDDT